MGTTAIILFLVGLIAFLAYKRGKQEAIEEVLRDEIQATEQRNDIRNMSDSELDDKLSDHWK